MNYISDRKLFWIFSAGMLMIVAGSVILTGGFKHAHTYRNEVEPVIEKVQSGSSGMYLKNGEGDVTITMTPAEKGDLMILSDYDFIEYNPFMFQLMIYLGLLAVIYSCSRSGMQKGHKIGISCIE